MKEGGIATGNYTSGEAPDKLLYNSYTRVIQKNIIDLTDELRSALRAKSLELPLKLYVDTKSNMAFLGCEDKVNQVPLSLDNSIDKSFLLEFLGENDLVKDFKEALRASRLLSEALNEVLSPERLKKKLGDPIRDVIEDLSLSTAEVIEMLRDKELGLHEKLRAELIEELMKDPRALPIGREVAPYEVLDVAKKAHLAYHMIELLKKKGLKILNVGLRDVLYIARKCYAIEIREKSAVSVLVGIYDIVRENFMSTVRNQMWFQVTHVDPEHLNPEGKMLFKNGVLDLETMTFTPIDSVKGYYFTSMIDIDLKPHVLTRLREYDLHYWENEVPKFLNHLTRMFPDQENFEKSLEMLGSLLIPSVIRKIFIMYGLPKTGKSTLLSLLIKCLPRCFLATTLEGLMDKFNYGLIGKYAVLTSEVSDVLVNVKMIATLNRVTGEEFLEFEDKYKSKIMARNKLKVVIATNELPLFQKLDDANVDRMYLIEVTGERVQDEKAMDSYVNEILRDEREGIIYFLLWNMLRIYDPQTKRVKFKYEIPIEEKKELIIKKLNPVGDWIKECCVEEGYEARKVLYDSFIKWADQRGKRKMSRNTFYSVLRQMGFEEVTIHGVDCFKGLSLKTEERKKTMEDYVEPP